MVWFISILLVALLFSAICYRAKKEGPSRRSALEYYQLMLLKFDELKRDCSMSDAKWFDWLPLFEDAEERFAQTHPEIKIFTRPSLHIKAELDDFKQWR